MNQKIKHLLSTLMIQRPTPPLRMELSNPGPNGRETEWSKWIARQLRGEHEVSTYDYRRADVVTDSYAVEVEWCIKSKLLEAIEQAKYYATALGKKPAIILLVGRYDLEDMEGRGSQRRRERDLYWACTQIATLSGVGIVTTLNVTKPDTTEISRLLAG